MAEQRAELAKVRIFSKPAPFAMGLWGAPSKEVQPAALGQAGPLGEAELAEASGPGAAPDTAPTAVPVPAVFPVDREASPALQDLKRTSVHIVDPQGTGLTSFFQSLERTTRASDGTPHITRVLHFGDSLLVSDYVSSTLRRLVQKRFGDAGHGYQLIANAWPSYSHSDVFRSSSGGFRVSRISGPRTADRLYGLGGVTFRGTSGLRAQFGTAEKGEFGRSVSDFAVSYLQTAGGGDVEVLLDGASVGRIHTNGPLGAKEQNFQVPDGSHRFELVLRGAETRLFGVVMERQVSGVTWSALGVQGARLSTLSENETEHFKEQIGAREPALLVFQFGINESGDGYAIAMPELRRTMTDVLKQARSAVPRASCLVVGAMDRARLEDGQVVSMRVIPLIVEQQKAASEAVGCAFFDTYAAMGGSGSMPRWLKRGLGNPDMMHPSSVGADRIATWIFEALMDEYQRYLESSRATTRVEPHEGK